MNGPALVIASLLSGFIAIFRNHYTAVRGKRATLSGIAKLHKIDSILGCEKVR